MFNDHYLLGYVVGTHGLRGEVKLKLDCDYPEDYKNLESVFLNMNEKLIPFFIEYLSVKSNGKAIAAFEDVETPEEAEALKGKQIYLPLSELPELQENQFYYHEIMGFQAFDQKSTAIGTVKDVYTATAQDLIALDFEGREILVPAIDEFIQHVDKENKTITFTLPEGFIDIS